MKHTQKLSQLLLTEHSKNNTLSIVQWIAKDEEKIKALLFLFMNGEYRIVQRAAWVLSTIADTNIDLVSSYLPLMVERMNHTSIPIAVKRNVLRILQFAPIPNTLHESLINSCFLYIENQSETVAVRAFSISVLARLIVDSTELKDALELLLIDILEHQETTPGFKSRAQRVLKQIKHS